MRSDTMSLMPPASTGSRRITVDALRSEKSLATRLVEAGGEPLLKRLFTHYVEELCRRAVQTTVDSLGSDVALFAPRTEEERRDGFAGWLSDVEKRFIVRLEQELAAELGDLADEPIDWSDHARKLGQEVWPTLVTELRRFAVRAIATRWAARQYPDAIAVLEPETDGDGWATPLLWRTDGSVIGRIALDADGNILTDKTTSRETVREMMGDDRRLPAR
jgi:hypothetical protein